MWYSSDLEFKIVDNSDTSQALLSSCPAQNASMYLVLSGSDKSRIALNHEETQWVLNLNSGIGKYLFGDPSRIKYSHGRSTRNK